MNNNFLILSHTLSEKTPSYGNRDRFFSKKRSSILNGDNSNTSYWEFSNNHIGTHIDAPKHFCNSGKTIDEIQADQFFFNKVCLLDIPRNNAELIGVSEVDFDAIPNDMDLLLIRTGYEKYRETDKYWNDNPGLTSNLAKSLREKFPKLKSVGFDFISLTSWKNKLEGKNAHLELLCPSKGNPILIIEDMKLNKLNQEIYFVVISPIIVAKADGAPVTVLASV
jgi:kynurenine formamidase